jgi:hypothetical protein
VVRVAVKIMPRWRVFGANSGFFVANLVEGGLIKEDRATDFKANSTGFPGEIRTLDPLRS